VEYEAARAELTEELNRGVPLEKLRARLTKTPESSERDAPASNATATKEHEKKVSKQEKKKKKYSVERIQRKNRDITQLLNKHKPGVTKEQVQAAPKQPTVLDLFTKSLQEGDDCDVLSRKLFKIGDKEILVRMPGRYFIFLSFVLTKLIELLHSEGNCHKGSR
jgi:alpha-glucan,water dikinase